MGNNKNGWVWQWDVQASERRELATKKAALATAEIVNLSKCIPVYNWHLFSLSCL
jgi:hypothetical protein